MNGLQAADRTLGSAGLNQYTASLLEENERLRRLVAAADQLEEATEREVRALRLEIQELQRRGNQPSTVEDTLRQLADGVGRVHIDAAIMAMRVEAARLRAENADLLHLCGRANLQIAETATAQDVIEALRSERQDLLDVLTSLDRDNTALIRRNAELAAEIARLAEAREASDQVHLARNAELAAEIARLAEAREASDEPDSEFWDRPEALAALEQHARDYWHGAASGRWRWRDLPRAVQIDLVQHVMSFGEQPVTKLAFDANRPHWMPTADSHVKTFGCSWTQLQAGEL